MGLDHGGQQLGRSRPRGARHRDRHARCLREPEREEAGAALIDVGVAQRTLGSRASESTSGALRNPGEVQAPCIPQRASSSTKALSNV